MLECLTKLVRDDEGQALVEYGLIIALIAVVVIGVIVTLGGQIKNAFQGIVDKMPEGDG